MNSIPRACRTAPPGNSPSARLVPALHLLLTVATGVGAASAQHDRFHFELAPRRYLGAPFGALVEPRSFLAHDVDGDGRRDLVFTDLDVLVARGVGHGFAPATSVFRPTGHTIDAIARGDRNGDGSDDLVLVGRTLVGVAAPVIRELFNNGAGGFTAGPVTGLQWTDLFVQDLECADLDGDNRADVVAWNSPWQLPVAEIEVRLGSGGTQRPTLPASTGLRTVVITDVDGDGWNDLVALVQGGTPVAGSLVVFRNQGGGAFPAAGVAWPLASGENLGLGFADVDGDGDQDAVSTSLSAGGFSTSLVVVINSGAGGFGRTVVSPLCSGSAAADVELLRLDEDAHVDVVVSFGDAEGAMVVAAMGAGDGSFTTRNSLSMTAGELAFDVGPGGERRFLSAGGHVIPVALDGSIGTIGLDVGPGAGEMPMQAVLDFDRDGRVDVAVVDGALRIVRVYLGDGEGGVAGIITQAVGGMPPLARLHAGDVDGDGFEDLILEAGDKLGVARNLGGIAMALVVTDLLAIGGVCSLDYYDSTVADLDGDGYADLVRTARHAPDAVFAFGTATGQFVPTCSAGNTFLGRTDFGDLDADGRLDMVVVNRNTQGLRVLFGTGGTPVFGPPTERSFSRPLARSVLVGDLDLDGRPEVLMSTFTGIVVAAVNAAGGLTETQFVDLGSGPWDDLALADMDGNGWPDLVMREESSSPSYRVVGNDGGTLVGNRMVWDFSESGFPAVSAQGTWVDVADFDADGYPDLLTTGYMAEASVRRPQLHFNRSALRGFGVPRGGNTVTLELAQPAAGGSLYVLLAGVDGSWPGLPLGGGAVLPLNATMPLIDLILSGGGGVFTNCIGFLDGNGRGSAAIVLPPGLALPTQVEVGFAFLTVDLATSAVTTSNRWSTQVR